MKIQCAHCGSEFEWEGARGKKKYCSSNCSFAVRRNRGKLYGHKKMCEVCGVEYIGTKCSRYCSRECTAKAKHATAKPRVCKTCRRVFIPEVRASLIYCSDACKPKQQEKCAHCGCSMPTLLDGHQPMRYCGPICKKQAQLARAEEKRKARASAKRDILAKGLKLWRRGLRGEEIARACGWAENSASVRLLESKAYRRATQRKKQQSKWHKTEVIRNARSKQFRVESEFIRYAVDRYSKEFGSAKPEVHIPGTRRKIDLVVSNGLFRFGVELKNGNRTARLDQTLGQAIVKCHALGGLQPVCCVPDDIELDKVFVEGCKHAGAIAGTISQCINTMKARCGL